MFRRKKTKPQESEAALQANRLFAMSRLIGCTGPQGYYVISERLPPEVVQQPMDGPVSGQPIPEDIVQQLRDCFFELCAHPAVARLKRQITLLIHKTPEHELGATADAGVSYGIFHDRVDIYLTRTILELATAEELSGAIAHEIGHPATGWKAYQEHLEGIWPWGKIFTGLGTAIGGGISLYTGQYGWVLLGAFIGGGMGLEARNDARNARLDPPEVQEAIRISNEYHADEFAVGVTRNPLALFSLMEKLDIISTLNLGNLSPDVLDELGKLFSGLPQSHPLRDPRMEKLKEHAAARDPHATKPDQTEYTRRNWRIVAEQAIKDGRINHLTPDQRELVAGYCGGSLPRVMPQPV